jgi:hypothetical protein
MANIRAFGKCVVFGFWIYEFMCFRSGYSLCFDLILGSKVERWRINNIFTMAKKTPNCDGEVYVLKFYRSF